MSNRTNLLVLFAAFSTAAFAIDGVTLINQSTVVAAGGFPYVITQPGSYKLAGNLTATSTTAISITAPYVTLDLNGFLIFCTTCSGVPGIVSTKPYTSISNGVVSGFGGAVTSTSYGIYLMGNGSSVDRVKLYNNGIGIYATGRLSVTNTVADSNQVGIDCQSAITVTGSQLTNNPVAGVIMIAGSITGNTFDNNGTVNSNPLGNYPGGVVTSSGTITNNVFTNIGNGGLGYGVYAYGALSIVVGENSFLNNRADWSGAVKSMGNNVCSGISSSLC